MCTRSGRRKSVNGTAVLLVKNADSLSVSCLEKSSTGSATRICFGWKKQCNYASPLKGNMQKKHLRKGTTQLLYWQKKKKKYTDKLIITIMAKVPLQIRLVSVLDAVHITEDIPQFQGLICMQLQNSWVQ